MEKEKIDLEKTSRGSLEKPGNDFKPPEIVLNVDSREPHEKINENDEKTIYDRMKKFKKPGKLWKSLKTYSKKLFLIENLKTDPTGKFSNLDVHSRKSFPVAFIISLIIYLLAFTYYLTDDISENVLESSII